MGKILRSALDDTNTLVILSGAKDLSHFNCEQYQDDTGLEAQCARQALPAIAAIRKAAATARCFPDIAWRQPLLSGFQYRADELPRALLGGMLEEIA